MRITESVKDESQQDGEAGSAEIKPLFTDGITDPSHKVDWENRDIALTDNNGNKIAEFKNLHFPKTWSVSATKIVADKFLRVIPDTGIKETSVDDMLNRVVGWYGDTGRKDGYFDNQKSHQTFFCELKHLLLNQYMAFNSPVWFNVGIATRPRVSACFILDVKDSMNSILDWYKEEGLVFKKGSGAGINLSRLRSSYESLSVGGKASGPVSFMRGADASAGAIKSGGACLAPYTLVYTAKGPVKVKDLAEAGRDFITLSYDPPAGRYKAKAARAWLTGQKHVVRITTDKGSFDLTADHPVRLSSHQTCLAGNLRAGQSILSCTINNRHGYLRVNLRDGKKGKETLHRLVATDIMGADLTGKVVHHKDENPYNNGVENLEVMTQVEHARLHSGLQVVAGRHVFQSRAFPKSGKANGMHSSGDFWQDEDKAGRYRQAKSVELTTRKTAAEMQKLAARQKMLNTGYKLLNAGYDISSFERYVSARKQHIGPIASVSELRTKFDRFGGYGVFVNQLAVENHRVVSVTDIGLMDVYDVEVDCPTADDKTAASGHNFVIWPDAEVTGSGIVIYNTRRAAKMVILDVEHPDIEEFINCKAAEEKKARVLKAAGFDTGLGGKDAYSLQYQNANNSVNVSRAFLQAYKADKPWDLVGVSDQKVYKTVKARQLMRQMAQAAWECADPGIFYGDTINDWHTSPSMGKIVSCNPCAEFVRPPDTSCNLASLRLTKFLVNGVFDIAAFVHAVITTITAMDISVTNAEYPTEKIAKTVSRFRELGIGFTDLGALLMQMGIPYCSEEGRTWAGLISAIMTAAAYKQSALLAKKLGTYPGWTEPGNAEAHLKVIEKHRAALSKITTAAAPEELYLAATRLWDEALYLGEAYGYRNAQVSLVAPTGTISFMMDADTTGIEPDFALVKFKKLVDGSVMKIVNQSIPIALQRLGYTANSKQQICDHIYNTGSVVKAPGLRDEHKAVFACAVGDIPVHYMDHMKMMAAVQPFISGAISKTVNLPNNVTVEEIEQIYVYGDKLELKNLALYRDGCKAEQVLHTSLNEKSAKVVPPTKARRMRLSNQRRGTTTSFRVDNCEGYIRTGEFPDGTLGEVFIDASKQGSTLSGLLDVFAISVSLGLQHGVPLEAYVEKFTNQKFAPAGMTKDPDFSIAQSLPDYIFRRLAADYLPEDLRHKLNIKTNKERTAELDAQEGKDSMQQLASRSDAPMCSICGVVMRAAGSCFCCEECGATSGCS